MKNSLVGLFLLFSTPIFGQLTVTERFQKIGTVPEAQQFIDANPGLKPALLNLSYRKDTSLIDKRPEIIGGNLPTGNYAMSVKKQGTGMTVLMPINIGRLYYLNGYQEHKNIFLDVVDYVYPAAAKIVITNAPARVEVIVQQYGKNTAQHRHKKDGLILHLINLTGFSGATYFNPLPVHDISFRIKSSFKPARVLIMTTQQSLNFNWENGHVRFTVKNLDDFNSVLIIPPTPLP